VASNPSICVCCRLARCGLSAHMPSRACGARLYTIRRVSASYGFAKERQFALPPSLRHKSAITRENHMDPIWAAGLMTGTVLDGNIDVALLSTDGETVSQFGPYTLSPYDAETRALLEEAVMAARKWNFEGPEPEIFARAEAALTRAQAHAVRALVESNGLSLSDIGIVGFHGQTVLHRAPSAGRIGNTRQLGDGELMARMLGVKVAYDFRTANVRAGGQGAPLSACYHAAL